MNEDSPIAILDSGVGGLSVLSALRQIAPKESLYYLGDTAHFPYGIKSPQLISELALKAAEELLSISNAKLLIIACHTISTTCLNELSQRLQIKVIGVSEPSTMSLKNWLRSYPIKEVAILSTKATLSSGYYKKAWQEMENAQDVLLHEFACGPLVNLVEDGYDSLNGLLAIANEIIPANIRNADAVLWGCTHFPVLEPALKGLFKSSCYFLDAAFPCAEAAMSYLKDNSLLSNATPSPPMIFVSDNPQRFISSAKQFILEPLIATKIKPFLR